MKIICSYCHKNMGEKVPLDDERLTHGICSECKKYFMKQIEGLPIDKYLENFKFPVLIINDESRIVAINEAASKVTGKSQEEASGLLGGDAMECAYARLPEGCGNTIHCGTCSIRQAVMTVMEYEIPQYHVPVKLTQDDQVLNMVINVKKIDSIVQVVIETLHVE